MKTKSTSSDFMVNLIKFKESLVTQSCPTLCNLVDWGLPVHGRLQPTRLLRPWDFPGKSTGVGHHCLLQRTLPTQGWKPGLPCCRRTLYCLSHQGSPNLSNCVWTQHLIFVFLLLMSLVCLLLLFFNPKVAAASEKNNCVPHGYPIQCKKTNSQTSLN